VCELLSHLPKLLTFTYLPGMHLNVTIKNVTWLHFSWATLENNCELISLTYATRSGVDDVQRQCQQQQQCSSSSSSSSTGRPTGRPRPTVVSAIVYTQPCRRRLGTHLRDASSPDCN